MAKSDLDMTVWPMDDMARVFPQDAAPRGAAAKAKAGWDLAAARGEFVVFQLGMLTQAELPDVEVSAGPLRKGRDVIDEDAFRVRWVGLVPVPQHAFWPDGAERPDCVPGWYPDPLVDEAPWRYNWPPRAVAVHVTLAVPRDAAPGRYSGRVVVKWKGKAVARVPLVVHVWPFEMPAVPTFHVTNWFQLDCLTKWHRCDAWSERHWTLIDLYAKEMAEHRQDVVSTPALTGNFHNSDPMALVDTVRDKKGDYRFDFKRLDRWVDLFEKRGIRIFELWHMASQGGGQTIPPFELHDEARGERVRIEPLATTSPEYRRLVGAFLRKLSAWADRREMSDRVLLHVFDEPQPPSWELYSELSKFYREHAPKLAHIDAISKSALITEFGADIDLPVPCTPHLDDADGYYRARAKAGEEPVWWYTCCGPAGRYANRFVYMPVSNTRMLHWQSFALNISGYLHWGYNFWHRLGQNVSGWPGINGYADHTLVNPYREHPSVWPVGDACIVYPDPRWWEEHGPVSSLRYEAMRAGLQDYEMFVMLDGLLDGTRPKAGTKAAKAASAGRRVLRRIRGPIAGDLRGFTRDAALMQRARRAVGDSIAAL